MLKLIVKSSWSEKDLTKFAPLICSIGMLLLLLSLTKLPSNTLKIFITLIVEEEIDVFRSGDFKEEFLYLILKLSKPIGHYPQNGEFLNTKALRNGG